jgi:hypothetical protein
MTPKPRSNPIVGPLTVLSRHAASSKIRRPLRFLQGKTFGVSLRSVANVLQLEPKPETMKMAPQMQCRALVGGTH